MIMSEIKCYGLTPEQEGVAKDLYENNKRKVGSYTLEEVDSEMVNVWIADAHSEGEEEYAEFLRKALAADAEILLVDEPTSGLDHHHMAAVAALLNRLAKRGKTLIVSTHDPELIALCCDYILCLEHGRVRYLRRV